MKTRTLAAVAAVSLMALLGACSSSSPDASDSSPGDSKQDTQSDSEENSSSDVPEECDALMTFTASIGVQQGDSVAGSIPNNSLTSEDVDEYFDPVEEVLDELPADFQAAFPTLDKAAHASVGPDLNDEDVLAIWAEPDNADALVTMVDTTRSVCGLPDTWMKDEY